MTDLFCNATLRGQAPQHRDDLPTLSDLAPWQRTELGLDHVAAAMHRLTPIVASANLSLPPIEAVRSAFTGGERGALQAAIYELHVALLCCLDAINAGLGKAYSLGRSLAYTCCRPTDADTLRMEFDGYRLLNLEGWLADLASALPDHASRAVSISLGIWRDSIPEPHADAKRWQIKDEQYRRTLGELHRQAKLWRAMLVGEKSGRDMLQPKRLHRYCRQTFHAHGSPRMELHVANLVRGAHNFGRRWIGGVGHLNVGRSTGDEDYRCRWRRRCGTWCHLEGNRRDTRSFGAQTRAATLAGGA